MLLCSLIEELCTKEENDKTGCNFNFGHEYIIKAVEYLIVIKYILFENLFTVSLIILLKSNSLAKVFFFNIKIYAF